MFPGGFQRQTFKTPHTGGTDSWTDRWCRSRRAKPSPAEASLPQSSAWPPHPPTAERGDGAPRPQNSNIAQISSSSTLVELRKTLVKSSRMKRVLGVGGREANHLRSRGPELAVTRAGRAVSTAASGQDSSPSSCPHCQRARADRGEPDLLAEAPSLCLFWFLLWPLHSLVPTPPSRTLPKNAGWEKSLLCIYKSGVTGDRAR